MTWSFENQCYEHRHKIQEAADHCINYYMAWFRVQNELSLAATEMCHYWMLENIFTHFNVLWITKLYSFLWITRNLPELGLSWWLGSVDVSRKCWCFSLCKFAGLCACFFSFFFVCLSSLLHETNTMWYIDTFNPPDYVLLSAFLTAV